MQKEGLSLPQKNKILPKISAVLVIVFLIGPVFSQERKNILTVSGGLSNVFEYGSEEDYVLGENDFPVTPSHTPPCFGLAYTRCFARNLGVEE